MFALSVLRGLAGSQKDRIKHAFLYWLKQWLWDRDWFDIIGSGYQRRGITWCVEIGAGNLAALAEGADNLEEPDLRSLVLRSIGKTGKK